MVLLLILGQDIISLLLILGQGILSHFYTPTESRPKTALICPYGKFQGKRVSYGTAHMFQVFSYPQYLSYSVTR